MPALAVPEMVPALVVGVGSGDGVGVFAGFGVAVGAGVGDGSTVAVGSGALAVFCDAGAGDAAGADALQATPTKISRPSARVTPFRVRNRDESKLSLVGTIGFTLICIVLVQSL